MKKVQLVLVALLCVLLCFFCACSSNSQQNRNRKINSINHRGCADAPENTLSAFRQASGDFSIVECDVRFTKDGVPVLLHDRAVDRTSNGSGNIDEMTFEEARKLDFGSWKNGKFAGEKIPTFEEFAQLCKELNLKAYVEIKSGASSDGVFLLAQIAMQSQIDVSWICFDLEILQQLSQILPNGRFGLLVQIVNRSAINSLLTLANKTNSLFLDCNHRFLTNLQINMCKKRNIPVEIWTLNNAKKIANLNPYISGVTSDTVNAEKLFQTL